MQGGNKETDLMTGEERRSEERKRDEKRPSRDGTYYYYQLHIIAHLTIDVYRRD